MGEARYRAFHGRLPNPKKPDDMPLLDSWGFMTGQYCRSSVKKRTLYAAQYTTLLLLKLFNKKTYQIWPPKYCLVLWIRNLKIPTFSALITKRGVFRTSFKAIYSGHKKEGRSYQHGQFARYFRLQYRKNKPWQMYPKTSMLKTQLLCGIFKKNAPKLDNLSFFSETVFILCSISVNRSPLKKGKNCPIPWSY